jgi:hypothetical protein
LGDAGGNIGLQRLAQHFLALLAWPQFNAIGHVTKDSRKKPFQFARGAMNSLHLY